jgi:uncharacterized protein
MADLYVSWEDYHRAIERVALKVVESGYEFDQIICLARGGLRVGDMLSRIFDQPLAVLATQSYFANADKTGEAQGDLTIGQHMAKVNERLGARVLLVDDLVDSGKTMQEVVEHLKHRYPGILSVKTAVIWKKGCSVFTPDFWADDLPSNPWIHQPFEVYDQMKPGDLAARLAR